MNPPPNQHPEQEVRDKIDAQLEAAGWTVQNTDELNLFASLGVAEQSERYSAAQNFIP